MRGSAYALAILMTVVNLSREHLGTLLPWLVAVVFVIGLPILIVRVKWWSR